MSLLPPSKLFSLSWASSSVFLSLPVCHWPQIPFYFSGQQAGELDRHREGGICSREGGSSAPAPRLLAPGAECAFRTLFGIATHSCPAVLGQLLRLALSSMPPPIPATSPFTYQSSNLLTGKVTKYLERVFLKR